MPTNLPPEYYPAEERYKAAQTTEEKIATLEELISTIPKHKGTDKLRADLRRRLSKLKSAAQSGKGSSRQASAFHIDKEGAGQVVVIGCTNVGKSALVDAFTNATPEVSDAPYTTWTPTPGMLQVENVQIQLIDTPPLSREYVDPELFNLIRRCELILLVVDLQGFTIEQLEDAVEVLAEHGILPERAQAFHSPSPRLRFLPFLIAVNKADDEGLDEDFQAFCELFGADYDLLATSTRTGRGLEALRWRIFEALDLIRVYSKPPGAEPDFSSPFVLHRGGTVEEFASKVHKDFLEELKSARVWGTGVFDGQMVGRDHVLHDGDVVELRT